MSNPSNVAIRSSISRCNNQSQVILRLPNLQDFVVDLINYAQQYVGHKDPRDCLAKRLHNSTFLSSPFVAQEYESFVFANCSRYLMLDLRIKLMRYLDDKHNIVLFRVPGITMHFVTSRITDAVLGCFGRHGSYFFFCTYFFFGAYLA